MPHHAYRLMEKWRFPEWPRCCSGKGLRSSIKLSERCLAIPSITSIGQAVVKLALD
jgi:hypothetical protein